MVGVISVATIPLMQIFATHETLKTVPGYDFNQFTLGNVGGS